MIDYSRICFVIMPFGKKPVAAKIVDFDWIYDTIFAPAVSAVDLPEGGKLGPRRTDQDFYSGNINVEMFRYLEYSRIALTDITGLNANVFYELGARHRTRDSGTAIFRQANANIPFDIQTIKVFTYEYEPQEKAAEARALIGKVLTESLVHNQLDSPIRLVLDRQQQQSSQIQERLKDAENALRRMDVNAAARQLSDVVRLDPSNPLHRIKLGMLQKDLELWAKSIEQFDAAITINGDLAEAWREKGIAESALAASTGMPPANPLPGELALLRAIELNDTYADAYASLGGVYRRAGRYEDARKCYARAREVSGDHPYPLLNEIKLRAFLDKRPTLTDKDRRALKRAAYIREIHAQENPPCDSSWCIFDLAVIRLLEGNRDEFLNLIDLGIDYSPAEWGWRTVADTLKLLESAAADLPGLKEGIAKLTEASGFSRDQAV